MFNYFISDRSTINILMITLCLRCNKMMNNGENKSFILLSLLSASAITARYRNWREKSNQVRKRFGETEMAPAVHFQLFRYRFCYCRQRGWLITSNFLMDGWRSEIKNSFRNNVYFCMFFKGWHLTNVLLQIALNLENDTTGKPFIYFNRCQGFCSN